jgi:hypothetical protein
MKYKIEKALYNCFMPAYHVFKIDESYETWVGTFRVKAEAKRFIEEKKIDHHFKKSTKVIKEVEDTLQGVENV